MLKYYLIFTKKQEEYKEFYGYHKFEKLLSQGIENEWITIYAANGDILGSYLTDKFYIESEVGFHVTIKER